jgi:serine phosphatase RsbU (regulator of sigma subunit)
MLLVPHKSKIIFTVLLLAIAVHSFADNKRKLDSLFTIIKTSKVDTVKINAHLKIANILLREDSMAGLQQIKKAQFVLKSIKDKNYTFRIKEKISKLCFGNGLEQKGIQYIDQAIEDAKAEQNKLWLAKLYFRKAMYMQAFDMARQAQVWFDSAYYFSKGADERLLAEILMEKGRAHYDNGEYKPAMNDYIEAQKLFEKNKWEDKEYGHLLHYLGSVFKRQKLYPQARDFYEKEVELGKKLKDRSIEAEGLYLCAQAYSGMGEYTRDKECVMKALDIFKELNNMRMVSLMYENLADNYSREGDYKKAIECLETSKDIDIQLGKETRLGNTYASLGDMYSRLGQHKKALAYLEKAMDAVMKVETKQLLNRANITESMAFAYAASGNYREAFDHLLEYRKLDDSLNNQSNAEYLHELRTKYETEKKESEIRLLSAEKKIGEDELHRKELQSRMLIIIAVLGVIVTIISVVAFMSKQKSSRLLKKQVSEINYQNEVIREKNKDITDSIQYAKRLQEAVFPEADTLNNYFAESFVLFRPKDIVSGDFYWFEQAGDKTILAVGDCTGHGVPGAFMSILGHNLLNQIILEHGNTNPADILRLLDKQVSSALNKRGNKQEYNDGMDIAICVIDKQSKTLSFAGANRPLVIQRGDELMELKQNKFAIGGIQDGSCKLFMKQDIKISDQDVLYLFSDGYYDQFGGPSGKKFKYKQLAEKFKSLANKPLSEQKKILSESFDNWRGNLEQLDDVCIIGIRI